MEINLISKMSFGNIVLTTFREILLGRKIRSQGIQPVKPCDEGSLHIKESTTVLKSIRGKTTGIKFPKYKAEIKTNLIYIVQLHGDLNSMRPYSKNSIDELISGQRNKINDSTEGGEGKEEERKKEEWEGEERDA